MKLIVKEAEKKGSGRRPFVVFYKGEWFKFSEIIKHPDFSDLELTETTVRGRYNNENPETIEALMRPKSERQEPLTEEQELRGDLSEAQWAALISGNNKQLLEATQ
jgi:hypothetical protein